MCLGILEVTAYTHNYSYTCASKKENLLINTTLVPLRLTGALSPKMREQRVPYLFMVRSELMRHGKSS